MADPETDAPVVEEDADAEDSVNFTTPTVLKDNATSTPDTTPSRRSSRKKQSTFSSDFEYYTPIGRKNQPKEEEKK